MRRLKGTCLSLAAEWGYMNYGHFLIDGLTRFDVFSKSGLSLSEVDYVFTSVPSPGLKALVWALGIPESKCIWGESGVAWKADRLLFCHYPGSYCQFAPEAPLFLQHALQAPAPKPGKRIYIQRNSRRKIVNESEILPALLAHGFEIYNYPGVFEQQRAFSEAECVIGVHGADMANLAFCAPGTRVLEIVPTAHQFAFFTNLSGAAGLKHFHWVAPSLEEKVPGWLGPSYADVRVDAVEFRRVLGEFMKN
jgi:capsular polysaccharide biosynthesis protein